MQPVQPVAADIKAGEEGQVELSATLKEERDEKAQGIELSF